MQQMPTTCQGNSAAAAAAAAGFPPPQGLTAFRIAVEEQQRDVLHHLLQALMMEEGLEGRVNLPQQVGLCSSSSSNSSSSSSSTCFAWLVLLSMNPPH
jgi:hypothetical protein